MATCDPETLLESGIEFDEMSRRERLIAKVELLRQILTALGGCADE